MSFLPGRPNPRHVQVSRHGPAKLPLEYCTNVHLRVYRVLVEKSTRQRRFFGPLAHFSTTSLTPPYPVPAAACLASCRAVLLDPFPPSSGREPEPQAETSGSPPASRPVDDHSRWSAISSERRTALAGIYSGVCGYHITYHLFIQDSRGQRRPRTAAAPPQGSSTCPAPANRLQSASDSRTSAAGVAKVG